MAELDLQTALSMFQDSTKQLMLSRAISGANDQVNQIRASEASEQDKRTQLQGISNNLVAHMASLGAPATTMQEVAGALGPKQYANAADMYKQGQLTGNSSLMDEATKQQHFEMQPELKKLESMANIYGLKSNRQLEKDFQEFNNKVNEKVDVNTTRFGNNSKLQGVVQQIDRVTPMLTDPRKFTGQALLETTKTLDSVLSGGQATITGTHELTPKLAAKTAADIQQMISNKPTSMAGAAVWQKYYQDIFDRIRDVNTKNIKEGQLGFIQGEVQPLLNRFPDKADDFLKEMSNKIGEPLAIDKKNMVVDFADNIQKQDENANVLQHIASNPQLANDPRVQPVLQKMGMDDRNLRRTFLRYPEIRKVYQQLSKIHK